MMLRRQRKKKEAVVFCSWLMLKTSLWYWAQLSSLRPSISLLIEPFPSPAVDGAALQFPDSGEFPSPVLGRGLGPSTS